MRKSAAERACIAQRKMSLKQGRLMAIFEAKGRPSTDDELLQAHKEAEDWVEKYTDANGDLKPGAPSIRSGLERQADG